MEFISDIYPNSIVRSSSNGVDQSIFQRQNLRKNFELLSVGSLRWQKGYKFLVDAMPIVLMHVPEARLTIIGEGPDRAALEKQIAVLGLEEKITLVGHLSHAGVARNMIRASCFVSSSVSEGLPKVLLEALACGCTVIATEVGESSAVIDGRGIVVEPYCADKLAEGVVRGLLDYELRKTWFENSANFIAEKGWGSYIKNAEAAYLDL